MARRAVLAGSAAFFLAGPGLEAGVGPWALTGFHTGDGLPGAWAVRALGAVLVVAGVAVLVSVFARFVAEGRGTPSPAAPTQRLIVSGAYRYVRNPMYVATAAVVVGEALVLRRPILLLAAGVYCVALALLGRLVEEPRLRARFGPEYDAYRAAVPAWRPRLRPWRA